MAYDEKLADRVRKRIGKQAGLTEKKMFGGVGFLIRGNMCCGVRGDELIVRFDPDETDEALAKPHTRVFDLSPRPMKGWILVGSKGVATDRSLAKWVDIATKFAAALPTKR
jgi:TfoX/Sxy family transcriptional regulator of competence genes